MNHHFFNAKRYRLIASISYLAILLLIPILIWENVNNYQSMWLPLTIWWLPLLPALPGLYKGKTYTYGWVGFILLVPFFYAFYYIVEPEKFRLASSVVALSVVCFLACLLYVKQFALAHGIKTNKDAKKAKGLE